jgi:hypothetical protein
VDTHNSLHVKTDNIFIKLCTDNLFIMLYLGALNMRALAAGSIAARVTLSPRREIPQPVISINIYEDVIHFSIIIKSEIM